MGCREATSCPRNLLQQRCTPEPCTPCGGPSPPHFTPRLGQFLAHDGLAGDAAGTRHSRHGACMLVVNASPPEAWFPDPAQAAPSDPAHADAALQERARAEAALEERIRALERIRELNALRRELAQDRGARPWACLPQASMGLASQSTQRWCSGCPARKLAGLLPLSSREPGPGHDMVAHPRGLAGRRAPPWRRLLRRRPAHACLSQHPSPAACRSARVPVAPGLKA
jgi:hypothetical protein